MNAVVNVLSVAVAALAVLFGWVQLSSRRAERAYPPSGSFIEIARNRYHYRAAGNGVPVVLLHGTGASLDDFALVFPALAEDFRTVAMDRPGHGYSDRGHGEVGTPVAQAAIVHTILHRLEIKRAIIVGHSWSGALALAYAAAYPHETLGLVLISGTLFREPSLVDPLVRILAAPLIGPLLANTLAPEAVRLRLRHTLPRVFAPSAVPLGYLEKARALWTRPSQLRAIAIDTVRRDATIDTLSLRYSDIAHPIVLVIGARDQYIDPENQSLRLARATARIRVRIIENAGHHIPLTHPDAVVSAIRELGSQVERSALLSQAKSS